MDNDVFCLFLIVACLLNLAMPAAAQVLFAVLTSVLVLAARCSAADTAGGVEHSGRDKPDRHDITGG